MRVTDVAHFSARSFDSGEYACAQDDTHNTKRRTLLAVIVIFAFCTCARTFAAPPPSFRLLLAPGVAPCALHVDATQFPLFAGTALTARYDWDFGDPGSKYNQLQGFVAAHLYARAGQYKISLTVTDEIGNTRTATATVVIARPVRRAVFISPDGDDAALGNQSGAPMRSGTAALKRYKGDDIALLFQAGRIHQISSTINIDRRDIYIGRYGDGADPILLHTPGGGKVSSILSSGKHCDGLFVEHITFDSPNAVDFHAVANKVGVDGIDAAGRNIVVHQCTFLNLDDGINANGDPVGLLMQDCRAPLATGLRAYMIWGQGADHAYLGNVDANSTREHCIRMFGLMRVLLADNDLTNLDRSKEGDRFDVGYYKGCIECQRGSYYYVVHNHVHGGQIRVGPLGVTESPGTSSQWAVIDGNTVDRCHIIAYAGAQHVMIRNNLIYNDNHEAISIAGPDIAGNRICGDFTIANNTAINNGASGTFLWLGGHANGISLMNNLFVAPHLSPGPGTALSLAENDLNSFTAIGHNIWPAFGNNLGRVVAMGGKQKQYMNATDYNAQPLVKQDRFADVSVDANGSPAAATGLLNDAEAVRGVWADHDGHVRPLRGQTVGAIQLAASPATTTTAP